MFVKAKRPGYQDGYGQESADDGCGDGSQRQQVAQRGQDARGAPQCARGRAAQEEEIAMAHNVAPAPSEAERHGLYERDYYTWALRQARALKERRIEALDWEHLAEEVEDLGRSEKRAVKSQLVRLLSHLLKWRYQPERRHEGWRVSVENTRDETRDLLADNPGLAPELPGLVSKAYKLARREARANTCLADASFPQLCPWTVEQVLAEDFWPES